MRKGFLFSLLLAFVLPTLANALPSPEIIRAQQLAIRASLEAKVDGPYKEMPASTRSEVLTRQQKVLELVQGKQAVDELTSEQQDEIAGHLAWIDAKLKAAEDERMVCERRPILGSNRKERVCKTVAQMRAEREAAREQMDQRGVCSDCKSN